MAEVKIESTPFEVGKRKVRNWTIAIVTILVVLFIWWKVPRSGPPTWNNSPIKSASTVPEFGPDSVRITTSFDGCKRIWNQDGTKFVDGHVVDKNVPWEIEYDGDPTKRYAMPPYNVPGEYTLTYKQPCTYFRIRILPNPEEKTAGEYAFRRVPR